MPYQPINFAGIKPITPYQGDATPDFIQEFMQALHRPKAMQEERQMNQGNIEKQKLANALEKQFGARGREAEINFMNKRAGELGGFNPQLEQAEIALKMAQARHYGEGGRGAGLTPELRRWNSLPSNSKQEQIAIAQGMGYSPDSAAFRLSNGDTLANMAEEAGMDIKDINPKYTPTTSNITSIKNAEGAANELDYLEKATTKDLAPFAHGTFFGYSPKQIISSFKGDDEKVGRFLGARALQPEIAGARSRVAGGSNAQEALHQMQTDALGSIKILHPQVTEKQFEIAQKYINEHLRKGFKARKNAVLNIKPEDFQRTPEGEGMVTGYTPGRRIVNGEVVEEIPLSTEQLMRLYRNE